MNKAIKMLLSLTLVASFMSCTEKDSDLGLALQDPSTIYNGIVDTVYGSAYTVFDDSLNTKNLNSAIIGSGVDCISTTVATFYSNVSTPKGASVNFESDWNIDSVVLSFGVTGVYVLPSDSSANQDLHFIIRQLDKRLEKDSSYISTSVVGVSSTVFFDDVVTLERNDSMIVRLKLTDAFTDLIANHSYSSADEFEEAVKGFYIELENTTDRKYVTLNLAASATRLTAYYTIDNDGTPAQRTYDFAFGVDVTHFSHFDKTFTGDLAPFNTSATVSIGGPTVYLSPLGGSNIRFDLDAFVRQFHKDHPLAIIHYAELILPVDVANAPEDRPESLSALQMFDDDTVAYVADMYDPFTYMGFDGSYDAVRKCYRMRITQHLQNLISEGSDKGTLIVISNRRTSWTHTHINGDSSTDPIRVEFVYSE